MRRADPIGVPGSSPKGPPPRGLKPGGVPPIVPGPSDAPAGAVPTDGAREPDTAAALAGATPVADQPAARSFDTADVVAASLLGALGGLVIADSVRMGIGWGPDGPKSGFVPFWLATILVSCTALTIVRAARRRSGKGFARRDQLWRVLVVLLPAAGMLVLTPYLGMYVAGALYMSLYMRLAGRHSWIASVALPVGFMVLVFLVFERWFLVPLPKGPLEAWLGY